MKPVRAESDQQEQNDRRGQSPKDLRFCIADILYNSSALLPSVSISSWSHLALTPSFSKIAFISLPIFSKFSVASANIVGPAPERQIPSRPGCDVGLKEDRISGSAGINEERYG